MYTEAEIYKNLLRLYMLIVLNITLANVLKALVIVVQCLLVKHNSYLLALFTRRILTVLIRRGRYTKIAYLHLRTPRGPLGPFSA